MMKTAMTGTWQAFMNHTPRENVWIVGFCNSFRNSDFRSVSFLFFHACITLKLALIFKTLNSA